MFTSLFLNCVLGITFTLVGWTSENSSSAVSASVDKLIKQSHLKTQNLGLIVVKASGEVVYELNSDKKFIPASLSKIVTAATILEKLPVGHQFQTELLVDKNDLYLRGGGDAGFVSESMWFLVNEFMRTGISEISGNIIVDDSRFDSIRYDPSREQTRVDRAYDAPIGAMTVNWSSVNIYVRPGSKAGDPARVFADPENDYVHVTNRSKTTSSGSTQLEVKNNGMKSDGSSEEVVVTGKIPLGAKEFVAYKSIEKPDIWAGTLLREFLRQRGISVKGKILSGKTSANANLVASAKSKQIGELVSEMMKFSNNYIAEILTKNLAAETKGKPGTMEAGISVIHDYLVSAGLKEEDFIFLNPSGLTRKNQFRPKDLLRILQHVQKRFQVYPEYLESLPIAGVDGTLKNRKGIQLPLGLVRAKTGHLAGIAGLGGYVGTTTGDLFEFIFIFNGTEDDAYKTKELYDNIIAEISR